MQQSCKIGKIQVIQVVVLIELAKYLSQELLAPNQCFKGAWRLGSGSLKEEIWFFTWVIKCVVTEDSSGVKKALFSLNYGTDASWDAVRIPRTTQFCNLTFLIVENSEFSRLTACLITIIYSLLHEFVKALIWPVDPVKAQKHLLNDHTTELQVIWTIRLIPMANLLGPYLNWPEGDLESTGNLGCIFILEEAKAINWFLKFVKLY